LESPFNQGHGNQFYHEPTLTNTNLLLDNQCQQVKENLIKGMPII